MADTTTSRVILAKPSVSTRRLLDQAARQLDAGVDHFAEHRSCLQRLNDETCSILVIDTGGGADEAVSLVEASKKVVPQPPVLALVEHDDIATAVRVMKAGAADCLEKPVDEARLRATLEQLLSQHRAAGNCLNVALTNMEVAVLYALLEGKTTREIATVLHRSPRTIEVHRRNITRKLEASNVVELVKRAATMGLLAEARADRREEV